MVMSAYDVSFCWIDARTDRVRDVSSPIDVAIRISMEPTPCDNCMERSTCRDECSRFKDYINQR